MLPNETVQGASDTCPVCQTKELQQLKSELFECKKSNQRKASQIKKLDKRCFVLMMIAIGIGAIFGKETLDSIIEWMGSISDFRSGATDLSGVILPAPSTLAVFALLPFIGPTRKRK